MQFPTSSPQRRPRRPIGPSGRSDLAVSTVRVALARRRRARTRAALAARIAGARPPSQQVTDTRSPPPRARATRATHETHFCHRNSAPTGRPRDIEPSSTAPRSRDDPRAGPRHARSESSPRTPREMSIPSTANASSAGDTPKRPSTPIHRRPQRRRALARPRPRRAHARGFAAHHLFDRERSTTTTRHGAPRRHARISAAR